MASRRIIKLDEARFLPNFKGNVIDLGSEIERGKFVDKMHPHTDGHSAFKYPTNRLLKLKDILAEDRMYHPDTKDHDGETSLFVIKRSLATPTTIGRATGSFSCAREYFSNQTHRDSIEWVILPYGNNLMYGTLSKRKDSGPFSKRGDSGSMIASGVGEFCGPITGGSGRTEPSDITYATPMFWLWPIIKTEFPNADLYPLFP